ncbi:MAG TPA: hypothetical protein VIT38_02070 [Allosphingosinicella sp.]
MSTTIRVFGDFGSNDARATLAIRQWFEEHMPERLPAWRELTPDSDLELAAVAWRGVAAHMIVRFNDLDPNGVQIDPEATAVDNAIRYFYDKPLGLFHQHIVDLADTIGLTARLARFEGPSGSADDE